MFKPQPVNKKHFLQDMKAIKNGNYRIVHITRGFLAEYDDGLTVMMTFPKHDYMPRVKVWHTDYENAVGYGYSVFEAWRQYSGFVNTYCK